MDWLSSNNLLSQEQKGSHLCSLCQFLQCNYSHHGQFQATTMMSLSTELGRDLHHWLLRESE